MHRDVLNALLVGAGSIGAYVSNYLIPMRNAVWVCVVLSVSIVATLGEFPPYAIVIFGKLTACALRTRLVPDFIVYPLDFAYMLVATGITGQRRARSVAIACMAASCIVMAPHSNVLVQPWYAMALRVGLYLGCVFCSNCKGKWAIVTHTLWIMNVHPALLVLAGVQLYLTAVKRNRARILANSATSQPAKTVVWTASGPMQV